MNLMILANFSQICQSKISSADLMILMNPCQFLLLHAFLAISLSIRLNSYTTL